MSTQPKPTQSSERVPVTADNFIRAESDLVKSGTAKSGGLGKFIHHREPMTPWPPPDRMGAPHVSDERTSLEDGSSTTARPS